MARKPKQQRSKATVDAIVQAALISIASHGPSAITARQIAEKAGIGVGSLYEYFEDKEAIIDAAGKRFVSDTVDLIKPLIPELVRLEIREAINKLLFSFRDFYNILREKTCWSNNTTHGGIKNLCPSTNKVFHL